MDRAREEKDKCELKGRTLDARERFDRDKAHSERRVAAFNTLETRATTRSSIPTSTSASAASIQR
jgi:hypothetical protein